jgi:hypothetical protein
VAPRAAANLAEAKAGARAAAAPSAGLAAPSPPRGAPRAETRTFPDCPGERTRTLQRDEAGRLLRRERAGTLGGLEYRAEERFGADGRLSGATLRLGGREVRLGADELEAAGLEPYPGLRLAPTAASAEAAPPGCAP